MTTTDSKVDVSAVVAAAQMVSSHHGANGNPTDDAISEAFAAFAKLVAKLSAELNP